MSVSATSHAVSNAARSTEKSSPSLSTVSVSKSNIENIPPHPQPRMKSAQSPADPRIAPLQQANGNTLPPSANFSMTSSRFIRRFVAPGKLQLPTAPLTTTASRSQLDPALREMFEKIDAGDLSFINCLPAKSSKQPSRQAFLDTIDPESGHTPLTLALSKGFVSIAETLLYAGSDVKVVNEYGYNALSAAARFGRHELTLRLLKECIATGMSRKEIVNCIDDHMHIPDAQTQHTVLTLAIAQGDDEVVEFLLKHDLFNSYHGANRRDALGTAVYEANAFAISKLLEFKKYSRIEIVLALGDAIGHAAREGQATLIIQLLAIYREFLRRPNAGASEAESLKHQRQKAESYDFALHGQRSVRLTTASAMERSTDHLQLNAEEIDELGLDIALARAKPGERAEQVLLANGVTRPEKRKD